MRHWRFDEDENRVACDDVVVQLTPKAAAVLGCLVRRKGEIVRRDELMSQVWPQLHVTKDLVREYVFDLRSALGDDARNPTYIETVRGKGFRLIGEVDFADGKTPPSSIREIRPTIAVLSPDIFAEDPKWAPFADGLADDIITGLAKFHDIAVVARRSSFAAEKKGDLREVAKEQNADYLLESSVAVFGETLRARFQLIDGKSGRNLWAERYNLEIGGLPDLSDQIATLVVNALTGWHGELHRAEFKVLSRKSPEDLNAFEHFIRGCDLELQFNEPSIRRCLFHLEKSLEIDPNFARCWVVNSVMLQWAFEVFRDRDPDLLRRSSEALERAYMLDPGDPVTLALYALKRSREGDFNTGIIALERAEASCAADADACVCVATSLAALKGDFDGAIKWYDAALRINPTPPSWYYLIETRVAFLAGDYHRSIACSTSAPVRQVSALVFRCLSNAMLDQVEAARIAHYNLFQVYPKFDLIAFAKYFPIANPEAMRRYRAGVDKLDILLADTGSDWSAIVRETST